MGRNGVKTGRIYVKLYMSIFISKNVSHPPKVFLSETLYFELPKNLVICFKRILASLQLDTRKLKRLGKKLLSKTNFDTFLQISCSNFRLKLCQRSQIYKNFQTNQTWSGVGQVRSKKLFPETMIHKIFEKTLVFM